MAVLGKDLSNRSDKITNAAQRGDAVYIEALAILYIQKFAEIDTNLAKLQKAMRPEVIDADRQK